MEPGTASISPIIVEAPTLFLHPLKVGGVNQVGSSPQPHLTKAQLLLSTRRTFVPSFSALQPPPTLTVNPQPIRTLQSPVLWYPVLQAAHGGLVDLRVPGGDAGEEVWRKASGAHRQSYAGALNDTSSPAPPSDADNGNEPKRHASSVDLSTTNRQLNIRIDWESTAGVWCGKSAENERTKNWR